MGHADGGEYGPRWFRFPDRLRLAAPGLERGFLPLQELRKVPRIWKQVFKCLALLGPYSDVQWLPADTSEQDVGKLTLDNAHPALEG